MEKAFFIAPSFNQKQQRQTVDLAAYNNCFIEVFNPRSIIFLSESFFLYTFNIFFVNFKCETSNNFYLSFIDYKHLFKRLLV
ncbi:hypothetical protein C3K47_06675 [Solitalea longa]|uniref:Uncharacterized protein n=1 Tax=Solitalea longa TaxID=2079460 RepID=A0A2S5A4C9_9SPHI|nr:hypothetical protein C3K47_06675 [Solitalea longa]